MKETIHLLLEMILSGGVLLAAYWLLLDRRVRPALCRAVLLVLPLLATVIPLLHIPVWPGGEALPLPVAVPEAAPAAAVALPAAKAAPGYERLLLTVFWTLWAAGSLFLFGLMGVQLLRIRQFRRGARRFRRGKCSFFEVGQRIAAFSFIRSIYLWRDTPRGELPLIVAHEAAHIRRRHSAERLAMEIMRALLWWNPCVWAAARLLSRVEEFEADADVLARGYDRRRYMMAILEQLLGPSPRIASGLGSSLTKQRFDMMTSSKRSGHAPLRLAALLPVLGALVCTFSFTTRAAALPEPPVGGDAAPTERVSVMARQEGKGLPGVVIRIDDTDSGAVTDAEGVARLSAAPGSVLHLSYAGCGERILYVRKSGHGEQAFVVELSERDAAASREGKPLYIVNGFPCERIDHIASDKVERIEVYKDATTLAKFGEAGRNGVIVIELKPGVDLPAPDLAAKPAAESAPASDSGEIYLIVEKMPTFRGGDLKTYRDWVMTQLHYPGKANSRPKGRVGVSFCVEPDGSVGNTQVLLSPDERLSEEVCRVLESTPAGAWTPGEQRGMRVRVRFTLVVDFSELKK